MTLDVKNKIEITEEALRAVFAAEEAARVAWVAGEAAWAVARAAEVAARVAGDAGKPLDLLALARRAMEVTSL